MSNIPDDIHDLANDRTRQPYSEPTKKQRERWHELAVEAVEAYLEANGALSDVIIVSQQELQRMIVQFQDQSAATARLEELAKVNKHIASMKYSLASKHKWYRYYADRVKAITA